MLYWNFLNSWVVYFINISRTETSVVLKLYSLILPKVSCFVSNRNKCCIEIQGCLNYLDKQLQVEPKQVLYWNVNINIIILTKQKVEPKQVLYWNKNRRYCNVVFSNVEPKQVLYWNLIYEISEMINNKRRTETSVVLKFSIFFILVLIWLSRTETSVVLKYI